MRPRLGLAVVSIVLAVWLVSDLNCSSAGRDARVVRTDTAPAQSSAPAAPASLETAAPIETADKSPETAAPAQESDLFVSTVRPILHAHCAPCHETGGVMYERLPFDHAEVVASHSAGVLRRIKAPDERAAIERWLGAQPPP